MAVSHPYAATARRVAVLCGNLARKLCLAFEWIQDIHSELVEIAKVPRDDGQSMHDGGGGNHGILHQGVGTAMLEPRPFAEGGGTHWEDIVREEHSAKPRLQFPGLSDILFPGQFDARLDLADGHHG